MLETGVVDFFDELPKAESVSPRQRHHGPQAVHMSTGTFSVEGQRDIRPVGDHDAVQGRDVCGSPSISYVAKTFGRGFSSAAPHSIDIYPSCEAAATPQAPASSSRGRLP